MLYLIPGLGADERVFQFLRIGNKPTKILHWETPEPEEPISHYASRLLSQVDQTQPIELLGVSFGGIIALEMAQQIPCQRLVLISSMLHPTERSPLFRIARNIRIAQWFPPNWMKRMAMWGAGYAFGPLDRHNKRLLKKIIKDTDPHFLQWASRKILHWEGVPTRPAMVRLHGTWDRIFPISQVPSCVLIRKAGHLMIVTHADEISDWIEGEWVK